MENMEMSTILQQGQELVANFGFDLIAAIVIFVVGRWVAKGLAGLVRKVMTKAEVDEMLVRFVGSLVYFTMLAFVAIAAVSALGVQTTSFIAVLGAAGLAVGLALQGSLANFASGVLIIVFRPYKVGDFVEAGGVSGTVEGVQVFSTIFKTGDNKKVIVPNSEVTAGVITNYSANETRRVDLVAGVGYEDDLDKVKQVLEDIVSKDDRILADPAPKIAVHELADSSVNLVVRPWVKTSDYWGVYFDLTEQIKKRFDSEGISIPFPQRDVHVYQHST